MLGRIRSYRSKFLRTRKECKDCNNWFQYDCPTHGTHSEYRGKWLVCQDQTEIIIVSNRKWDTYEIVCVQTWTRHIRHIAQYLGWYIIMTWIAIVTKLKRNETDICPKNRKSLKRQDIGVRIACSIVHAYHPGHEKHKSLNWTTCYDEYCQTHYSSKMDNSWTPQPRGMVKHENLAIKEKRIRESRWLTLVCNDKDHGTGCTGFDWYWSNVKPCWQKIC